MQLLHVFIAGARHLGGRLVTYYVKLIALAQAGRSRDQAKRWADNWPLLSSQKWGFPWFIRKLKQIELNYI